MDSENSYLKYKSIKTNTLSNMKLIESILNF